MALKKAQYNHYYEKQLWKEIFQGQAKSVFKKGEEIGQGVWSQIKHIRELIPDLSMGDLPKFTEAFRQKVGIPLRVSALESLRGMT